LHRCRKDITLQQRSDSATPFGDDEEWGDGKMIEMIEDLKGKLSAIAEKLKIDRKTTRMVKNTEALLESETECDNIASFQVGLYKPLVRNWLEENRKDR